MSRHVTWKETVENMIGINWGRQAESENQVVKDGNDAHLSLMVLVEILRTLRDIDQSLRPLRCSNFQRIPGTLNAIKRNTTKRRKKT